MSEACIHDRFTDCDRGCEKCVRYVPRYECCYCGEVSYKGDTYKIDGEYVCNDCIGEIRDMGVLNDFLDDSDIMEKYQEYLKERFSDCLIQEDSI